MDKTIIKNVTSLMSSQAFTYILPLLTYPHIIKKIGLGYFGEVQFVLTVMTFLTLFIEFGYGVRSPRDVAMAEGNTEVLSKIFSRTTTHKLISFVVVVLGIHLYVCFFSEQPYILYLGGLVYLLNLTMSPSWFFQGVEKMEYIAYVDITAKLLFTASIFLLIRQQSDYVYILPLWGVGGLISAIAGTVIILVKYKLKYRFIGLLELWLEAKKGYFLFLSNISAHSIYNSQILILGVMQGADAVGIYAIADKIIRIPWTMAALFSHAIYPRVCMLNKQGPREVFNFYKKTLPIPYILCLIVLLAIFGLAEHIIRFLSNVPVAEISLLLRVLLVSVLVVIIKTPFYHFLLANEKDKLLMKMFLVIAALSLILGVVIIHFYGYWGAAIANISTLIIMMFFLILESRKIINKSLVSTYTVIE